MSDHPRLPLKQWRDEDEDGSFFERATKCRVESSPADASRGDLGSDASLDESNRGSSALAFLTREPGTGSSLEPGHRIIMSLQLKHK